VADHFGSQDAHACDWGNLPIERRFGFPSIKRGVLSYKPCVAVFFSGAMKCCPLSCLSCKLNGRLREVGNPVVEQKVGRPLGQKFTAARTIG